ncbi:hypothetical protein ENBRE01_1886, partial [Enteropsectra breve]
MKLFCITMRIVTASFTANVFTNPLENDLSVQIIRMEDSDNAVAMSSRDAFRFDSEEFLLSEIMLSNTLCDILEVRYKKGYIPLAKCFKSKPEDFKTKESAHRMCHMHSLEQQYTQAIKNISYKYSESTLNYSGRIRESLGLSKEQNDKPKEKLLSSLYLKGYDCDVLRLIFDMRHQLFPKSKLKATPELAQMICNYYEELKFAEDSVSDIFIKNAEGKDLHFRIKSDIIFGLNLYWFLKKQKLHKIYKETLFTTALTELKRKCIDPKAKKKGAPVVDLKTIPSLFNNIPVIKQLFLIMKVRKSSKGRFSIEFVKALDGIRFEDAGEGNISLRTNSEEKLDSEFFFTLFNEENRNTKSIFHLEAVIPKMITENLDKIFCAILELLPQIKEISLLNIQQTEYNCMNLNEQCTLFDTFIHTFLSENEEICGRLTGFILYGYNSPDLKTRMLLKRQKFAKFGMRGIFCRPDQSFLFNLFANETGNSIYDDKHKISKEANVGYNSLPEFNEYNNLRNSVIHFVGTEDIVTFVAESRLLEDLTDATIYLTRHNSNFDTYKAEKETRERLLKYTKTLVPRQKPLLLNSLTVLPEPYFMDARENSLKIRTKIYNEPSTICLWDDKNRSKSAAYNVSKLIISHRIAYKPETSALNAIRSVASYNECLEITLSKFERNMAESASLQLLFRLYKGNTLVVNVNTDSFIVEENEKEVISYDFCFYAKMALYWMYYNYFFNPKYEWVKNLNDKKLIIRFKIHANPHHLSTEFFETKIKDYFLRRNM